MPAMNDPVAVVGIVGIAVLGACVGSFLNVCIHRWPRNLKVNQPARSFCPSCERPIPWHENLPILSWLLLRGKCAGCRKPISPRYLLVELLTAAVFLLIWLAFPPAEAAALIVLAVACIVTVFVDFEHYIIPDQVTWGILPFGILASVLVPGLHGEDTWLGGLAASLLGAVAGFAVLWGVVEMGKRLFGRKTRRFEDEVKWELREGEEAPDLVLGSEVLPWEDLFNRVSDRLIIEGSAFKLNGKKLAGRRLVLHWDRLAVADDNRPGETIQLDQVKSLEGRAKRVVIPREAMGFGDVKFLAMAGAFIGWKGVLLTVFAASLYGSIFGIGVIVLNRRNWAGRIPFGPWLVAGVWTWILFGEVLLDGYLAFVGLRQDVLF